MDEECVDGADAYAAVKALADGTEEAVPHEVASRLLAGESPLRVWREHRSMTQQQLAEASGLTQAMITMIETKRRKGTTRTLKQFAEVLRIDVDDLV